MIITVTGKTARLELTTDIWYEEMSQSQWGAAQDVLLSVNRDYNRLRHVDTSDLTEDAQTRLKLLKEIMR